ncbi:MAG: VCBS repeat-containing protein, partial [Acidobacteriota bacterium]
MTLSYRILAVLILGASSSAAEDRAAAIDPHPAKAAAEPWFEDITASAGVDFPHHTRSFKNPYAHIMEGYTALGASAAVADIDGDGFEDVFFTDSSEDGKNRLYLNRGDLTFAEIGVASGVAEGNDAVNASANSLWFDYDNDGDPDLLV